MTWTAIEGSLMTKFNKVNGEFGGKYKPWIQWHIKVIKELSSLQHNETFEGAAGVHVAGRTLTDAA